MLLHIQLSFPAFFFFGIFLNLSSHSWQLYAVFSRRGEDLVMVPQLTIPRTVLKLSFLLLLKRLFIANADMSTKARLYILDEYCYSSCRVRFQIIPHSSAICRCLHIQKWVWSDMKETLVNVMCFFLFSHPHRALICDPSWNSGVRGCATAATNGTVHISRGSINMN